MKTNNNTKLYNILLPIWILVFWPSPLWLILIPANYLIDRIVLRWSLGEMPEKGAFCRKHTWKICIAGFVSDLIGACVMFGVFMCSALIGDESPVKPLICIYLIDKKLLGKAGLTVEQAKKSALRLALITAPYLYFFPSELIYRDWI